MSASSSSFNCIRPVTASFPTHAAPWDDTNLPLACVVTPLAVEEANQTPQPAPPRLLTGIAKCLHCGAPHPTRQTCWRSETTSSASKTSHLLLCGLCGHTSSTLVQQQQEARGRLEGSLTLAAGSEEGARRNAADTQPSGRSSSSAGHRHSTCTFALPLRMQQPMAAAREQIDGEHPAPPPPPLYSIPAMACPVLWCLVLDGSCRRRSYWQAASRLLLAQTLPAHVHVSILLVHRVHTRTLADHVPRKQKGVVSEDVLVDPQERLGIYQLASPVPHLLHYTSTASDDDGDLIQAVLQSLVPASSAHLPAAARSLLDYLPPPLAAEDNVEECFSLAWICQLVATALLTHGQPVGRQRLRVGAATTTTTTPLLPYAGGRITALLSPSTVTEANVQRRRRWSGGAGVGLGGVGGQTVDEPGRRFGDGSGGNLSSSDGEGRPFSVSADVEAPAASTLRHLTNGSSSSSTLHESELTPENLARHYRPPPGLCQDYAEVGRQCAQAALGVDVLCLVDSSMADDDDNALPDYGLPLVSCLVEKTGAPGPLLFDLNRADSVTRLEREFVARTPWQPGIVFGAELRLRLSPGFQVDDSVLEELSDQQGRPQLAPLSVEAGLMGPATAVEESTHLWRMGVCDPYTSLTLDLAVQHHPVPDRFVVEGWGPVALHPVIQTCFAYTTVVRNPETGQYQTVRQMRISSVQVPLARSVEAIYSSMDPEALAVVLFHKLVLASYQDGLAETVSIAEKWLKSLLVCAYQSAELEEKRRQERHGRVSNGEDGFWANERLLDRDGELSVEEVLLAQGHDRVRTVPLMIYLLLQSDAFRPSRGVFRPSIDLRYAALSQLATMTPTTLTRCIAPRVQLWSSGQDTREDGNSPIQGLVDLRREAIQLAVMDLGDSTDLIIFVDSPHQLVVMDGRYVNASASSTTLPELEMSDGLKQAIEEACQSYRTRPVVVYELGQASTSGRQTFLRLMDVLIEDAPSSSGHENFSDWRTDIALSVHEDLEKA